MSTKSEPVAPSTAADVKDEDLTSQDYYFNSYSHFGMSKSRHTKFLFFLTPS
jgi:hypothetical protein